MASSRRTQIYSVPERNRCRGYPLKHISKEWAPPRVLVACRLLDRRTRSSLDLPRRILTALHLLMALQCAGPDVDVHHAEWSAHRVSLRPPRGRGVQGKLTQFCNGVDRTVDLPFGVQQAGSQPGVRLPVRCGTRNDVSTPEVVDDRGRFVAAHVEANDTG